MPYPNTKVLQLGVPDTFSVQTNDKTSELANDQLVVTAHTTLDAFAGFTTASCCYSMFVVPTGSYGYLNSPGYIGHQGVFGAEYARQDRTFVEAVAWAAASGSGGVSTIDVQVGLVNFQSVFASTASMLAVSASLGNYGLSKSSAWVSGSNTRWPAGMLMRAQLLTAVTAAGPSDQEVLTVQIFWKPSGSTIAYGV